MRSVSNWLHEWFGLSLKQPNPTRASKLMHPLGSLGDQLDVITNAEVEILLSDIERYSERTSELAKRAPGLRLLAMGDSQLLRRFMKTCKTLQSHTEGHFLAGAAGVLQDDFVGEIPC